MLILNWSILTDSSNWEQLEWGILLNFNYDYKIRPEYLIKNYGKYIFLLRYFVSIPVLSFSLSYALLGVLLRKLGFLLLFIAFHVSCHAKLLNKTWTVQNLEEQNFHKIADNRISVKTSACSMKASMEHGSKSVINQMEFRKLWVSADC